MSEQGAEAPHSGAPKLTRFLASRTPILQVGKLRPSEGTSRKPPGSACLPASALQHAQVCTRPGVCARGTSAPRIQKAGWRGQAWPGAGRLDAGPARAHACSDAHSGLRGPGSLAPEVESTPDPPASHYVPHNAWVPLITARRSTPGRASFHSRPQPQPLISA